MSAIKLFVHSREGVSLPEALAVFAKVGGEGSVGLLYSPRSCVFAMMAAGRPNGSDGRPVDLSAVYEARVFSKETELRWLNDPTHEKRHRAVILIEQDRSVGEGWERSELSIIDKLAQTYLLWGEGTEAKSRLADGWSLLATPRIGGLAVPVGGARNDRQRVLLHTLEYLTECDYGNVVVADERLCRLEVVNG